MRWVDSSSLTTVCVALFLRPPLLAVCKLGRLWGMRLGDKKKNLEQG